MASHLKQKHADQLGLANTAPNRAVVEAYKRHLETKNVPTHDFDKYVSPSSSFLSRLESVAHQLREYRGVSLQQSTTPPPAVPYLRVVKGFRW